MAVISMEPLPDRQADLATFTDSRASRKWIALTNNRFDDEATVIVYGLANHILPEPWFDYHPTILRLLCRGLSAECDPRSPMKWIVTATYSCESSSLEKIQSQFLAPLSRPAKIRFRKNKYQKPVTKDINGKPFVNAAGDPFDPPVELARGHLVCAITKNVASPPAFMGVDGDVINSDPFIVIDELGSSIYVDSCQAKVDECDLSDIQSERDSFGINYLFYTLNWSFEINREPPPVSNPGGKGGWRLALLNQGFRARRPGGQQTYNILDNSTPPQPISSPALLDSTGYILANPSPDTAVYLEFQAYYEMDFNFFPIS